MRLLQTDRLWNRASHNAFTDITRLRDSYYIVFREGERHISASGTVRVLRREDGQTQWLDLGSIALEGADLRDPKLCVTPDNRLMMTSAAAYSEGPTSHQTKAWFSDDGRHWSDPVDIAAPNHWLWRINWHEDHAYGLAYGTGAQGGLYWYQIDSDYSHASQRLTEFDGQYVNEHDLCFAPDGKVWCLLRRDNTDADKSTGLLGRSVPPYDRWEWQDLGFRIGGPCLEWDEDSAAFFAAYRRYEDPMQWVPQWTEIARLGLDAKTHDRLELPSGGDCSYPGLCVRGDQLEAVYYSSHEEDQGTAIYLATIALP